MDYPILCYGEKCQKPAVYKIAARWSHGASSELKTYGLACEDCLPVLFRDSMKRQTQARTLPGELGERPGIYQLFEGWRDRDLVRLTDLEEKLKTKSEETES